jgi:hypothetical protein
VAKGTDQAITYLLVFGIIYFAHKEGIINLNSIINELKNLLKPGTGTGTQTCPSGQTWSATSKKCIASTPPANEEEEEGTGEEEEEEGGEEEEEEEDEDSNLARARARLVQKINRSTDPLYLDRITVKSGWP